MIDLQKQSGLPIELKDDLRIKFDAPLSDREPTYIRQFSQMLPVLKDINIPAIDVPYLGYRKLYLPKDKELVESQHLEYDLTIIPPLMLGDEFNKTLGHYHANIPGTDIAHPELYEVISGHALFLIQKMDPEFKKVIDVIGIEAQAGDKIVYPPNYGHIIVNIGSEVLVTANWLSTDYKPLYEPVADYHGMAYYAVKDVAGKYSFVKNQNYSSHPEVRMVRHEEKIASDFGFISTEPMYLTGTTNPKKLEFLVKPQLYLPKLARLTS